VRAGTAVIPPAVEGQQEQWTRAFIASMHQRALGNAGDLVRAIGIEGVGRMLDVGGGSGAYAIAFAKASRSLRADVFDLPSVAPLTREYIRDAGVADRVAMRTGDMRRDDLGSGYDLALLSAICHMFSPEENQDLFRRCRRALAPGGRLVIRDFIVDPDRTSPTRAVMFTLNMLVGTKAGSTYTEEEYRRWLNGAGFDRVDRPRLSSDLIVATRP
jgi:predicted O-methyltransferase YrrM